ncbi:MAG: exodeoxyribonuclease VII large subunit [Castellaniella sp.]
MSAVLPQEDGPRIWSVSELNRVAGRLLQSHFARIWVRGEISSFTQAASGHWYFSIKDSGAVVRAVMFRGRALASGEQPAVGDQFEFLANVTLYEPRGEYQLQVESLRRAGRGDLYAAWLRLRRKLEDEGLMAPERRRAWTPVPRAIGVITSLGAAALRDVLTTLARRAPHVRVIVYPSPVQGQDAAPQLVEALALARRRAEVDTLLLVRGGGSMEDLWSFNDETLARAVADRSSPIPVISGVGHETDFTICDFVADARAATPTAAAELACEARTILLRRVFVAGRGLDAAFQRHLDGFAQGLDRAMLRLVSPAQRLQQQTLALAGLDQRLHRTMDTLIERQKGRVALAAAHMGHVTPEFGLERKRVLEWQRRLDLAARRHPRDARERLAALMQTLQALGPQGILARGYAIVRDDSQRVVKNALDLKIGQSLSIEFDQGTAQVGVKKLHSLL